MLQRVDVDARYGNVSINAIPLHQACNVDHLPSDSFQCSPPWLCKIVIPSSQPSRDPVRLTKPSWYRFQIDASSRDEDNVQVAPPHRIGASVVCCSGLSICCSSTSTSGTHTSGGTHDHVHPGGSNQRRPAVQLAKKRYTGSGWTEGRNLRRSLHCNVCTTLQGHLGAQNRQRFSTRLGNGVPITGTPVRRPAVGTSITTGVHAAMTSISRYCTRTARNGTLSLTASWL